MSCDGLDDVRCFEHCSVRCESSAFPEEPLYMNSKVYTITSLSRS